MRFLHSADWHLGRLFFGTHLTDDQAYVLDQFVDLVKDEKPDAVIIAGDIYDRAIPPPDAVSLLDETLTRISQDLKTPTIVIAGNHDSPERLRFGSRLLADAGVHVACYPAPSCPRVTFEDDHGPIHVYCVPFAEPHHVSEILNDETIVCHESAMRAIVNGIQEAQKPGERSILVGHAFVSGGVASESERPLSIGGAETVSSGVFEGIDYTALGHLHAPQKMNGGRVRYSGSLLKYSFSEVDQKKGVHLVEMDSEGSCNVETISLTPKRDVRVIKGTMEELLKGPASGENPEDYLMVRLEDRNLILDAVARLRDVYPNVMHLEREFAAELTGTSTQLSRDALDKLNHEQLFVSFFENMTGLEPTDEQREAFLDVVKELEAEERGA